MSKNKTEKMIEKAIQEAIVNGDFKIEKPVVFYDLETTGTDVMNDRIVSMAFRKIFPDGTMEVKSRLINPTIPIPMEATEIHGITDKMIKNEPMFANLAKGMYEWLKGCDVGGFNNNHFDNTVLSEEFARCDILFPDAFTNSLDVGVLFKKLDPRTLIAAVMKYLGIKFEDDAHDADADNDMTVLVFFAMLQKHEELDGMSVKEISDFCKHKVGALDPQGKLYRDEDGDICFNFGKAKGSKVKDDLGFADWVLKRDFTLQIKLYIRKAIELASKTDPDLFK